MKKAAVIPSRGIGDALLMMIASHQLHLAGYEVTTFHPSLSELKDWFPGHSFSEELDIDTLSSYSLVIFENDNSDKVRSLKKLREEGTLPQLSIFYPSYILSKHGPLSTLDRIFDETRPMAENIAKAMGDLLGNNTLSKDNGIKIPHPLSHRQFANRVVIHPTSSTSQKNWTLSKYVKLAKHLQKQGFQVAFSLSPKERAELLYLEKEGIEMPLFTQLGDLACYLYESGILIGNDSLTGHLASNLQIPTLIIADNKERMQLWRPGWLQGEVITPPHWLPRWNIFRENWQSYVFLNQVLKAVKLLQEKSLPKL